MLLDTGRTWYEVILAWEEVELNGVYSEPPCVKHRIVRIVRIIRIMKLIQISQIIRIMKIMHISQIIGIIGIMRIILPATGSCLVSSCRRLHIVIGDY